MKKMKGRSLSLALLFCFATLHTAGAPATIHGEVVETYCWVVHTVGGPPHAQCGIECAKRGLLVALYDSRSHSAYILLPARDKAALPSDLVAAMGQRVKVQGEVVARGGIQFLVVQSWQRVSSAH